MKTLFHLIVVALVAALFLYALQPDSKGLSLRSPWLQLETK
ncbi:hypothetical protein [Acidovorax sp. sic0104]|nr:hypothetical protein [Acidovorax sp. sic0104]